MERGHAGDAVAGLIVIDTSAFVIDLRYKRDKDFSVNRAFLERAAESRSAATTIFNLLEVCGILSFNLNDRQLRELFHYFPQHYQVEVLPHASLESSLPACATGDLFNTILKKMSFGDALIAATIEKHVRGAECFVSWNAQHFKGKLSIPCLNPRQFLKSH